jgi:hypothetical protein
MRGEGVAESEDRKMGAFRVSPGAGIGVMSEGE